MGLSQYEQETIINYNEKEQVASIYTCRPSLMRKLSAAKWAVFLREEKMDGKIISKEFEVPKSFIKISPKRRVTEKQREAARRSMQKLLLSRVASVENR